MLFLRKLPPNEAWLLIFFALVLTADFIRVSVTVAEMIQMRPTKGESQRPCRRFFIRFSSVSGRTPIFSSWSRTARTVHFTTSTLFPCSLPCVGSLKA
jgi:hypothetical protein